MDLKVYLKTIVQCLVNGSLSEKLCRVCLSPLDEKSEDIETHFSKNDLEYCVADILNVVCGIQFDEMESYSVCSKCLTTASVAYEFYTTTKRSNSILNFYISELQQNIDVIDPTVDYRPNQICLYLPDIKVVNSEVVKPAYDQIQSNENTECMDNDYVINEHNDTTQIVQEIPTEQKPSKVKEELSNPKKTKEQTAKKRGQKHRRERLEYMSCSQCPIKYRLASKLKEHLKLDHNLELYICQICKHITEDKSLFNAHILSHTNVYICAECGVAVKKRSTIILHLQQHEETRRMAREGAHMCDVCGLVLANENDLKSHCDSKHVVKHSCPYCGKLYKGLLSLNKHIDKHKLCLENDGKRESEQNSTKSFQCSECNQTFTSEKALTSHSRTHTSRFKCETCDRGFVDARALMWHQRLHNNERPYACEFCPRRFVSASRRNAHSRCTHSAPAYRCPLCDAAFHLRSIVNSHVKKVHLKQSSRRRRAPPPPRGAAPPPVPLRLLSVPVQTALVHADPKSKQLPVCEEL